MGTLDRERVDAHLRSLEDTVAVLRTVQGWQARDLADEATRLWTVAHGMQIAIQNVVDIAAHLSAALATGEVPESYHDAILALGRLGLLDPSFAERIAPMAGLRNILVHGYLRLDVDRLVTALRSLDDFGAFASAVEAFLAANPGL